MNPPFPIASCLSFSARHVTGLNTYTDERHDPETKAVLSNIKHVQ